MPEAHSSLTNRLGLSLEPGCLDRTATAREDPYDGAHSVRLTPVRCNLLFVSALSRPSRSVPWSAMIEEMLGGQHPSDEATQE